MSDDVMSAAEAVALLAGIAPRRACYMCGAVDPPVRQIRTILAPPTFTGPGIVDVHDGCRLEPPGAVSPPARLGAIAVSAVERALRAVVALHGRAVGSP